MKDCRKCRYYCKVAYDSDWFGLQSYSCNNYCEYHDAQITDFRNDVCHNYQEK